MGIKDGRIRKNISLNALVQMVTKENQTTGRLTKGKVAEILTNSAKHPHGIKVKLHSGQIGRVRKILSAKKGETLDTPPPEAKKLKLPWERY